MRPLTDQEFELVIDETDAEAGPDLSAAFVWLANVIIYTLAGIFIATLVAIPDGDYFENARKFWAIVLGFE